MTRRSNEQNKRLHAMLRDIAEQVTHPQAGKLGAEAWKALFLEELGHQTEWLPSLYGERMVPMRWSSSALEMDSFSDLIELMFAYGGQHGVQWTDPEWQSQMEQAGGIAA